MVLLITIKYQLMIVSRITITNIIPPHQISAKTNHPQYCPLSTNIKPRKREDMEGARDDKEVTSPGRGNRSGNLLTIKHVIRRTSWRIDFLDMLVFDMLVLAKSWLLLRHSVLRHLEKYSKIMNVFEKKRTIFYIWQFQIWFQLVGKYFNY